MNKHLLLFMEAIILEQLLVRSSGISSWPCFSTVCFSPVCGLTDLFMVNIGSPWITRTDKWKVTEGSLL